MSYRAPQWEVTWHPGKKRYYYQDRVSGSSQWSQPAGCSLALPSKPPTDASEEQPPMPENIPAGWKCQYNWEHRRYFYYRASNPNERTWWRPKPVADAAEATAERPADRPQPKRKQQGSLRKEQFFAHNVWDADAFMHRIQEAHAGKDQHILRDILTEVVDSNNRLLGSTLKMTVPTTVPVQWNDCMKALQERKIEDYGGDPKVTVGGSTLADAVAFFAGQDNRRVVVCLNAADGTCAGGGYRDGMRGVEEDLCRRIPTLYPSLHEADEVGCYPFGPTTCLQLDSPEKYADALFTPRVQVARGSEEEGFPILPTDRRPNVSVVSVSPPYVSTKQELATPELIGSSIMSIFVAPVYKEPRCTTLIIGPWACNRGVPAEDVADYFVKGLIGDLPGIPIKLGRLYHEVHFAIPPPSANDQKDVQEVFIKALRQVRVPFTEL